MRKLFNSGKGFTLVELMVVMAILAVLAAIVFPAVTGVTTTSRETAQPMDINNVQTGTDRFNADDTDGKPWPTLAPLTGTAWQAGELPTLAKTGSGTLADPYVFEQTASDGAIAGVDWSSQATVDGVTKKFYPDYLRTLPDYSNYPTDKVTVAASSTSPVFKIKKGGEDVYVQLKNSTGTSLDFHVWGIDNTGEVWVFVDADSY
jgi:prepilin-type N-terminal cleavage/methylation domain-containing protein